MADFAEGAFLIDPAHLHVAKGGKRLFLRNVPMLKSIRLRRHGTLARGEVVFCARVRDEGGGLIVHMKFRFQTPDGRSIDAVERFSGISLPGETLPEPRTPLVVYYAADDCYTVL